MYEHLKIINGKLGMRFHSLDGLRAVAAILVVIYHLGLASWADAKIEQGEVVLGRLFSALGGSGVELFFTLSGVLLLRPHFRSGRPMHASSYFWRRIRRLYPPFFLAWIIAGLTVIVLTKYPTWWESGLRPFSVIDWISQIGIVSLEPYSYNYAWWSLNVEILFYSVVPLLVFLIRDCDKRTYSIFLTFMIVFSQLIYMTQEGEGFLRILWQIGIYASCFGSGVFLAKHDLSRRAALVCIILGALWVILSCWSMMLNAHVGFGLLYLGVVSIALSSDATLAKFLSTGPMVWLGERSYSLFLTHYPVIFLSCWIASHWFDHKGLMFFVVSRAIAVPAAMLVACLLFHWVERRFANGLATADDWLPSWTLKAKESLRNTGAVHPI